MRRQQNMSYITSELLLSCMVCSPMGSTLPMVYYGARLSACRWIRYVINCMSFAMTLHPYFLVCKISHPQANCLIIPNSFEQRLQFKDEIFKHPWGDRWVLKCQGEPIWSTFQCIFDFSCHSGLNVGNYSTWRWDPIFKHPWGDHQNLAKLYL